VGWGRGPRWWGFPQRGRRQYSVPLEVPGMRGVYSHITPGMREDLTAGLQELWAASLREQARISDVTSPGAGLSPGQLSGADNRDRTQDRLPFWSQNRTPESQKARPSLRAGPLICGFSGVGEGTRTPGPQDHNNAV
jgi:hypothetical protein